MSDVPPAIRRFGLRTNTLAGFVATIISNATTFLINVLLIKLWGETDHGRYMLVLSVVSLASLLVTAGVIEALGVRDVAVASGHSTKALNERLNALLGTSGTLGLVLGAALLVFGGPIAAWLDQPVDVLLRLACTWPLAMVLLANASLVSRGLESLPHNAVSRAIFHACQLGWLGAAAALGLGMTDLFIGWTWVLPIAGTLALAVMWPLARSSGFQPRLRFIGVRRTIGLLAAGFPFLIANSSPILLPAGVQVIIGYQTEDPAFVSYFQAAFSLSLVVLLLAIPMAVAAFPTISRLIDSNQPNNHRQADTIVRGVFIRVALLGLVIYAGVALLDHWLLRTLFRPIYGEQALLLNVLTIAAVAEGLRLGMDQALFAGRRERLVGFMEVLRYAVIFVGTVMILPRMGLIGIGWLMVATNTAAVLIRVFMLDRWRGLRLYPAMVCWAVTTAGMYTLFTFGQMTLGLAAGVGGAIVLWLRRHAAAVSSGDDATGTTP